MKKRDETWCKNENQDGIAVWHTWRISPDGERTLLGAFTSRDQAVEKMVWDYALHHRSNLRKTDLATALKGHLSRDEMLNMFYSMPPLQPLIEEMQQSNTLESGGSRWILTQIGHEVDQGW